MTRNGIFLIFLFGIFISLSSGFAQQTVNPDSALQAIINELTGTRLSLSDAVEHALKSATSVRTAEASYLAARGAARREAGRFDPELFLNLNYLDQDQPAASVFAGANILQTAQLTSAAGVRWFSPLGISIEASVNTVRLHTNSNLAFLNPQFTSFGNIAFRQPLLGGLFVSARREANRTDRESEAAKARYDQTVLATSTEVEENYWDLYATGRDYAVQRLTRDRAAAFLRDTELRGKTGLIGPNQVANARTFLAEQEILLLDREEQLERASNQFATLIGVRPDSGSQRFIPMDAPPESFSEGEVETLVRQASSNNLDLQAARADVEARRASANAAFWQALPSVDFIGSIGGNGLAGTPQRVRGFGLDTIASFPASGFGDAVDQAVNRLYPSWSVGVEVSIPLLLRSGLGEKDRLEAEVVIAEQRQLQMERVLEAHVRLTHQEVVNGERRLQAARAGVDAAAEQVRIGQIEFQNGRTTAFELVRLAADFAVAQQRYSQSLVRSAKAAATLRRLTSGAYPSNR